MSALPLTQKAAERALLRLVRIRAKELGLTVQEMIGRVKERVLEVGDEV